MSKSMSVHAGSICRRVSGLNNASRRFASSVCATRAKEVVDDMRRFFHGTRAAHH